MPTSILVLRVHSTFCTCCGLSSVCPAPGTWNATHLQNPVQTHRCLWDCLPLGSFRSLCHHSSIMWKTPFHTAAHSYSTSAPWHGASGCWRATCHHVFPDVCHREEGAPPQSEILCLPYMSTDIALKYRFLSWETDLENPKRPSDDQKHY